MCVCVCVCVCVVWKRKEKACIKGLKLILSNQCSLASTVAAGLIHIHRGKPSGVSEGFDHEGFKKQGNF